MKKILITGAAGFVGRHFVRRFLEKGHEVHAVDSVVLGTGGIHPSDSWPLFDPRSYGGFHFYHQDCRDWFRERTDSDFDYSLHLAAVVGGRQMIENFPLAVADDLSIDAAYWQWATRANPAKTLTFSSSAAYPIKFQRRDTYVLLTEEMIEIGADVGMPDMSYGWAKLTSEYLGKLGYEKHGLKSVVYRPFSGYGEDQDATYPFPAICRRVLENRGAAKLTVWGTGEQKRDFIHIEDCVNGVLLTMDAIDNGDALNLSTGLFTSFKEFAGIAARLCGYSPVVEGTSNTPEGVFARGGDTRKQGAFGFKPTISLEEGVQRGLNYFLSAPAAK
jgi:GDP-L-fucose synthase